MNIRLLLCALFASLLSSISIAQPDSLSSVGIVRYDGIDLIELYAVTAELDVTERAEVVNARLVRYASNDALVPDSFRLIQRDSSFSIFYGRFPVVDVLPEDANAYKLTEQETADLFLTQIVQKLEGQNFISRLKEIAIEIVLALLVIVVLYVVIRYMNRLFRFLNHRLVRSNIAFITAIRIRNYEFLSKERVVKLLGTILLGIKWLTIIIVVYISLPILFSIFPGTEGIARALFALVLDPVKRLFAGLIGFLPNLFTIGVIAIAVRYAVSFTKFLASEIRDGKLVLSGFYPDWAMPTYQILRFILYAFGFVMIFPYLPGSGSPIFQGVSVFLGLLVSFGSSSAISNAVAGVVITYMRPFRKGDRVKVGDVTGDVIEKTLLVTRLRTIKNEEVTVPNSAVLNGHTINYTTAAADHGLILYTTVTIGYDVPWTKVHELLIKAAQGASGVDHDRKPFVLQTSLDDYYVSYQLNAYTREPHRGAVIYSEIHSRIQDLFNEAGVEILSPHYRAARDGNMITIPANYLPPDYAAPRFGVDVRTEENKGSTP